MSLKPPCAPTCTRCGEVTTYHWPGVPNAKEETRFPQCPLALCGVPGPKVQVPHTWLDSCQDAGLISARLRGAHDPDYQRRRLVEAAGLR